MLEALRPHCGANMCMWCKLTSINPGFAEYQSISNYNCKTTKAKGALGIEGYKHLFRCSFGY
jgi:hypothetical protein